MKKISQIETGGRFLYGGVEWVKLYAGDGTVAISAEPVFERAFDENNKNDWRSSSLRRELNGAFLDALVAEGADRAAFLDWESDLTAAADVVFAASPGLRQRLLPCSDNIALLPNGANPQMFLRDGLEPPELVRQLPRPVFARVGDVSADLELAPLVHTAQRRPQWTFLLLGRVGQHALQVLSPLPNVTLAGPVPAVELPDYLSGCQVLFDLVRSRRRGSDVVPGRIYEYLSTGKPIVTMLPPEQTEFFPDAIYAAFDPNGFLRRCQLALDEDDSAIRDRRIHYAQDASWSRRAREIARILADTGLF